MESDNSNKRERRREREKLINNKIFECLSHFLLCWANLTFSGSSFLLGLITFIFFDIWVNPLSRYFLSLCLLSLLSLLLLSRFLFLFLYISCYLCVSMGVFRVTTTNMIFLVNRFYSMLQSSHKWVTQQAYESSRAECCQVSKRSEWARANGRTERASELLIQNAIVDL